jgi:dihydroflavonol-4-reductase
MRVAVTGGAGFVGHAVVRHLRERGDQVVALVRDAGRASHLAELGVEIVPDDLSDIGATTEHLKGVDGLIHAAGSYRIGIPRSEHGRMWDANVGTTTRVLDAAEAAGVPRIVYVSTVNVFGNTHGQMVDESYRRDLSQDFLSWYDETKYGAHEVAQQRIADGDPIVIVMPSQVYGPGDHSGIGEQMRLAFEGRLRYRAVDGVGVNLVHVDDLAAGIVVALDRGRVGESYVLAGPAITLREAVDLAAAIGEHRPPNLRMPTGLLRLLAPAGGLIGQPNVREVITASAGVTYWAGHDKATAELGFEPRPIEAGLRDTFRPG